MQTFGMRWVTLDNLEEVKRALAQIGSDSRGIGLMAGKGLGRGIKLEQVPLRIAHILKQGDVISWRRCSSTPGCDYQ